MLLYEVRLARGGASSRLWVYLPEKAAEGSLPCVFIGPAGSNLLTGMRLGDGDRPEHLPYVRAGFAVVAYELDGALASDDPTDEEFVAAFEAFSGAEAGVANAREALDYALAKIPQVDRERLYVAGHSSAATLALLVAEREPRVKACVAYAPVADIEARLGPQFVKRLSGVRGFVEFIRENSPLTHASQLSCPLFIFGADDDNVVQPSQPALFAAAVAKVNRAVTYVRVPTGGHYDSMIKEGVPRAIKWLQELKQAAPKQ